jgi:hypothetical protein
LSSVQANVTGWGRARFSTGRYYKQNDAAFLSTVLADADGAPMRFLRAYWTAYVPADPLPVLATPWQGMPDDWMPRAVDASLAGSRLEVQLLDEASGLYDPEIRSLAQAAPLVRSGRFRYRVRFLPTPTWTDADRLNLPVLESPWLDDVTFDVQPLAGPRVLAVAQGGYCDGRTWPRDR